MPSYVIHNYIVDIFFNRYYRGRAGPRRCRSAIIVSNKGSESKRRSPVITNEVSFSLRGLVLCNPTLAVNIWKDLNTSSVPDSCFKELTQRTSMESFFIGETFRSSGSVTNKVLGGVSAKRLGKRYSWLLNTRTIAIQLGKLLLVNLLLVSGLLSTLLGCSWWWVPEVVQCGRAFLAATPSVERKVVRLTIKRSNGSENQCWDHFNSQVKHLASGPLYSKGKKENAGRFSSLLHQSMTVFIPLSLQCL